MGIKNLYSSEIYIVTQQQYNMISSTCMHEIRVMAFTYQKLSIGTDSQSHHMTFVTYHTLHPLPVAGEYDLLLPSRYIPWRGCTYRCMYMYCIGI
jgi:hypothetical protein